MVDKLEQEFIQNGTEASSNGVRIIPDKLIDSIAGAGPNDPPRDGSWVKAYVKWTKAI